MGLRQISQSHLTLLEHCPRKFQHIYLEHLSSPLSFQEQVALKRGSDLHYLMQQQELQLLPMLDPLPQSWPEETVRLYQMAHSLGAAIPTPSGTTRFRQSEYRLHHEFAGVLLTVVYDLLVLTDKDAYIFDWKTYSRPPDQADLARHWQTQLYPFVLAATSDYAAADITLSYWFIQPSQPIDGTPSGDDGQPGWQPDCIRFEYGDRLHDQIHHHLTQMLQRLQQWVVAYEEHGQPLPQTDQIQDRCRRCPFALRCGRSPSTVPDQWADLDDIEAIEEIPLPN